MKKYIVSEVRYHILTDKELVEMLSVHAGSQDYNSWLKALCDRKCNSAFAREMTRSVRKYLEDYSS